MNAIAENKKFITTAELKDMGYSYYKIGKLEEQGILSRVNRSTYENLTYKGDENDFFSAEAFVPNVNSFYVTATCQTTSFQLYKIQV